MVVPLAYLLVFLCASFVMLAYEDGYGNRGETLDWYSPESMNQVEKVAYFVLEYVIDFPLGLPFWFREPGDSPAWRLLLWIPTSLLAAFLLSRRGRSGPT